MCLVPIRAFYEGHRAETVLREKTESPFAVSMGSDCYMPVRFC